MAEFVEKTRIETGEGPGIVVARALPARRRRPILRRPALHAGEILQLFELRHLVWTASDDAALLHASTTSACASVPGSSRVRPLTPDTPYIKLVHLVF